jgi:hypothetical protein
MCSRNIMNCFTKCFILTSLDIELNVEEFRIRRRMLAAFAVY